MSSSPSISVSAPSTSTPSVKKSKNWALYHDQKRTDLQVEIAERVGNYIRERDRTKLRHDAMLITYAPGIDPLRIQTASARVLSESMLAFTTMTLSCSRNPDRIPEILRSLKRGHLLGEARRLKIVPAVWPMRLALYLLGIGISFAVPALISQTPLSSSSFWINGSLLSVCTTILVALLFSAFDKGNHRLTERIAQHFTGTPEKASEAMEQVAGMIYRLEKPLAFVVPHFDRLDEFSKQFIRYFMGRETNKTVGSVLWILMEPEGRSMVKETLDPQCPGHGLLEIPGNWYHITRA